MEPLASHVIYLGDIALTPEVAEVRRRMVDEFGGELTKKRLQANDLARHSVVMSADMEPASLLDVGVAQANFLNALALRGHIGRLAGIDIREYKLFTQMGEFEYFEMDASNMSFADDEFECVTAMEVLEHQPDGKMEAVLAELRRVAARRLVVTVPFCEPLPLGKHHSQQFTPDRVTSLFPNARYTLLLKEPVTRVPWLLIEEDLGVPTSRRLGATARAQLKRLEDKLKTYPRIRKVGSAVKRRLWVWGH